jgi:hypothetical protein
MFQQISVQIVQFLMFFAGQYWLFVKPAAALMGKQSTNLPAMLVILEHLSGGQISHQHLHHS